MPLPDFDLNTKRSYRSEIDTGRLNSYEVEENLN